MRHHANMIGLFVTATFLLMASPASHARKKPDTVTTSPPYVTETRIAAPRQVGDFALAFIDTASESSAEIEYAHTGKPEIRVILHIMAVGDMPVEEALAMAVPLAEGNPLANFFADSKHVDVQRTTPVPFEISATNPAMTSPLAGLRFDTQSSMRLDFLPERVSMQTRDFVFYRGMHIVYLSVSAATSRMDRATFETIADRAARELVPNLTVSNIGRCGESSDKIRQHCFVTRDDAQAQEPAESGIATLAYKAGEWDSP